MKMRRSLLMTAVTAALVVAPAVGANAVQTASESPAQSAAGNPSAGSSAVVDLHTYTYFRDNVVRTGYVGIAGSPTSLPQGTHLVFKVHDTRGILLDLTTGGVRSNQTVYLDEDARTGAMFGAVRYGDTLPLSVEVDGKEVAKGTVTIPMPWVDTIRTEKAGTTENPVVRVQPFQVHKVPSGALVLIKMYDQNGKLITTKSSNVGSGWIVPGFNARPTAGVTNGKIEVYLESPSNASDRILASTQTWR